MGSQGGEHPHSTALQRPLGACSVPSAAAPFQETLGEEKIKKSYFFHSQLERGQILQQDAFLFYFILFVSGQHIPKRSRRSHHRAGTARAAS